MAQCVREGCGEVEAQLHVVYGEEERYEGESFCTVGHMTEQLVMKGFPVGQVFVKDDARA